VLPASHVSPPFGAVTETAGITTADIAGVVHSVTFRAVKPAAAARTER